MLCSVIVKMQAGLTILLLVLEIAATATTSTPAIATTTITPANALWSTSEGTTTIKPKPKKPKQKTTLTDIVSTSVTPAESVWTIETTTDTPLPKKPEEVTVTPVPDIFSTSMTPAESVWTMETTADTPLPKKPEEVTVTPVPDIFSTSMTPVKSVWTMETTADTPLPKKPEEVTVTPVPDIFSTSVTPVESIWTVETTADTPLPKKPEEVTVTPVPDIFSTSMTPAESVWTMETTADTPLPKKPKEVTVTPVPDIFSTSMLHAKSDTPMKPTVAMAATGHETTDIDYAKMLLHTFVDDCDVKIRPIKNQSQPIKLKTKFVPVSIVEFDTTSQKFSVLGYFRFAWFDETIRWWKSEYNGLKHMIVPSTSVWKPNAIIQESYNGNGVIGNPASDQTRIGRSGHTQWVPDGTYSVVCDVDIQYYPFDEQFCKIIYYIADETTETVELNHDSEVPLEEINENSAWKLLGVSRKKVVKSNNYYIEIVFHLSRRPNYATFTLVVPLLMLAALNMCMFLVPIESGEKGGLAITVVLSYGIFISILSDKLPHNSLQTSFFVVFITLLLVLSVLSVLYSVIQAKLVISIGANDSLFGCFRMSNPKLNGNQSGEGNLKKSMTWAAFFQKMDVVIFIVFMAIVLVASTGFFFVILRRITKDAVHVQ